MSVQNDYYKFICGEYDPTGWKSQWRRDFECRQEEEAASPVTKAKAA